MGDVKMPEVGSEWVHKVSGVRVTVIAVDVDNPLGPQVRYRFDDDSIGARHVDDFYRRFDPASPPMPTVADWWLVATRARTVCADFTTEAQADAYARRFGPGLLVARMVCVEVREPRPAEEASDG